MAFYRCGGGGIPSSLKTDMNAVLNKKFGTSTDYPPADWAPTVNLMGPLPEKTIVSSPIADFNDGADDVPTKSLVVTIPPTLSGVSSVTETQSDGDEYEHEYTASLGRTIYGGTADIVNGQGTESYGRIIFDGSNDEFWQKHGSIASWFYIDNAITDGYVNNAENDFMICNLGTQAKYASVAQLSNGQFAFGRPSPTTYRFVFKNTDFTEVADFKAWLSNNNMQVVYKLATPTDYTFDGQEVPTRLGYNAFWSDEGDTEVTYRADINLALGGQ